VLGVGVAGGMMLKSGQDRQSTESGPSR